MIHMIYCHKLRKKSQVFSLLLVVFMWIALVSAAIHIIVLTEPFENVGAKQRVFFNLNKEVERATTYLDKSCELSLLWN